MYLYPKHLRHFRGRKTIVNGKPKIHPAYVVGEDGGCYLCLTLTHSPKKGKNHPNHRLAKNPDPTDKRDAYLRKQLEKVPKTWFEEKEMKGYRLPKKDESFVEHILRKRRD